MAEQLRAETRREIEAVAGQFTLALEEWGTKGVGLDWLQQNYRQAVRDLSILQIGNESLQDRDFLGPALLEVQDSMLSMLLTAIGYHSGDAQK